MYYYMCWNKLVIQMLTAAWSWTMEKQQFKKLKLTRRICILVHIHIDIKGCHNYSSHFHFIIIRKDVGMLWNVACCNYLHFLFWAASAEVYPVFIFIWSLLVFHITFYNQSLYAISSPHYVSKVWVPDIHLKFLNRLFRVNPHLKSIDSLYGPCFWRISCNDK